MSSVWSPMTMSWLLISPDPWGSLILDPKPINAKPKSGKASDALLYDHQSFKKKKTKPIFLKRRCINVQIDFTTKLRIMTPTLHQHSDEPHNIAKNLDARTASTFGSSAKRSHTGGRQHVQVDIGKTDLVEIGLVHKKIVCKIWWWNQWNGQSAV